MCCSILSVKQFLAWFSKENFKKNDNCSVERKQGGSKTISWTCPMISDLHIKKIDFQLPGNLTDDNVILDTVQLPVKNHLFLDVSSDDLC